MHILLSHDTSLAYWRYHFPLDSELEPSACAHDPGCGNACKTDVLLSIPEEFILPGQPADILVFDETLRRRSLRTTCHTWQTDLPSNAFFKTRGVYVSSPEFTFLQMASKLPIEQLIALGCELCGTYVLVSKNAKPRCGHMGDMPTRLTPLTSVERLTACLNAAEGARGKKKGMRALKYVVEGSRSPMETMVYMLLCLPAKLGGYGLPKPKMNATIELDDEARVIARRSYCMGDLCWPDEQLDIEYHGEVHAGAAQMKSDIGRELGIEHMGWRVITVTSLQVLDAEQFGVVAKEAASYMQKRLRTSTLNAVAQRTNLRCELERWMSCS